MVLTCCAVGCFKRGTEREKNVMFHAFPKNAALRNKWIIAVRRRFFEPGPGTLLCSKHFKESDYEMVPHNNRRRLKKGTVPSIFAHTDPNYKLDTGSYLHRKSRKYLSDKPSQLQIDCSMSEFLNDTNTETEKIPKNEESETVSYVEQERIQISPTIVTSLKIEENSNAAVEEIEIQENVLVTECVHSDGETWEENLALLEEETESNNIVISLEDEECYSADLENPEEPAENHKVNIEQYTNMKEMNEPKIEKTISMCDFMTEVAIPDTLNAEETEDEILETNPADSNSILQSHKSPNKFSTINDFVKTDLDDPVKREKYWRVSQTCCKRQKNLTQFYSYQNFRLVRKIRKFKNLLDLLKKQNQIVAPASTILDNTFDLFFK